MVEKKNDVFLIVNPHAGGGKGYKDWNYILHLMEKTGIPFCFEFTEYKMHAFQLAAAAVGKGFKTLIAVGGDGTLNEIANGILDQKKCPSTDIALGMIPVGSGNDWCRTFHISDRYEEAIKCIINRKIFIQDAGRAGYFKEGVKEERFFVNIAGIGFDAEVVRKTNRQKEKNKSGKFLYLYNLITSLLSSKYVKASIRMDGKELKRDIFSMNVGICKYSGGGMMQAPNAIADDGLFDVTIINKIGKFDVIRNVKNLYDGSFIRHPKVEIYRSEKVTLNSDLPLLIEADGESLGHSPLSFEIIPRCLKIITGF